MRAGFHRINPHARRVVIEVVARQQVGKPLLPNVKVDVVDNFTFGALLDGRLRPYSTPESTARN